MNNGKSQTGREKSSLPAPCSMLHAPRSAFTLVELLVVITIIGILAGLITAAAIGAVRTARQARIKLEVNEISGAVDQYKNKAGSYPPNALTDYGPEPISTATKAQVLTDLKRHFKQAFPNSLEPNEIFYLLVDAIENGNQATGQKLLGGMTAEEAVVFWLGGFSNDSKYPISGTGGPSYDSALGNNDPIESRKFVYPFDVNRLGPRDPNGKFDDSAAGGGRYIVYTDPRNPAKQRRINFWTYTAAQSEKPFVYFDTSRYTPDKAGAPTLAPADPPARPDLHVHALKQLSGTNIRFANQDKFQVMHCGIDGSWGTDFTDLTSYDVFKNQPTQFLAFPTGPFSGEMADNVVNFITQSRLEDAQP